MFEERSQGFKYMLLGSISCREKQKIYIISLLVSLFLLSYSILDLKWAVVDVNDFLGLTSHLSFIYWLGLMLVVLTSLIMYFDNRCNNSWTYVFALLVIALFLFGIGIFSEENARNTQTYSNIAEVKNIDSSGFIGPVSQYSILSYRCWPSYHLLSYFILSICDIQIPTFLKYVPLLFIFLELIFLYLIGALTKLNDHKIFLMCCLFLTSSFTAHCWYPSPQTYALCIYLLLFAIILAIINSLWRFNAEVSSLLIILFTVLVMTHFLTPVLFLASFFIASFYKKFYHYRLLLPAIFFIYMIYLAPIAFQFGIEKFYSQMISMDFLYFAGTTKFSPVNPLKEIINFFRLSYLIIYAALLILSIISFKLYPKVDEAKTTITKFSLIWLLALPPFIGIQYGMEIFERLYALALAPLLLIVVIKIDHNHIIASLIILFFLLHIPAHYGSESLDMVTTTELNGADFFANYAIKKPYLYSFPGLIRYHNPDFTPIVAKKVYVWESNAEWSLSETKYLLNSKREDNFLKYHIGFNPLQDSSLYVNLGLIYNNNKFNIYYFN